MSETFGFACYTGRMSDQETKCPSTSADESAIASVDARVKSLIDGLPPEQREALLRHPARDEAINSLRDGMLTALGAETYLPARSDRK